MVFGDWSMVTPTRRGPQVPMGTLDLPWDPADLVHAPTTTTVFCNQARPELCNVWEQTLLKGEAGARAPSVSPSWGFGSGNEVQCSQELSLPTGGVGMRISGSTARRPGPRIISWELLYTKAKLLGPTGAPVPTTSKLGCCLVLGLLVRTWTPNHKLTSWPDLYLPHCCGPAVPDPVYCHHARSWPWLPNLCSCLDLRATLLTRNCLAVWALSWNCLLPQCWPVLLAPLGLPRFSCHPVT